MLNQLMQVSLEMSEMGQQSLVLRMTVILAYELATLCWLIKENHVEVQILSWLVVVLRKQSSRFFSATWMVPSLFCIIWTVLLIHMTFVHIFIHV